MWTSSFASITVGPVLPLFFTPFDTLNNGTSVGDAAQLVSTTLEIMENVLDERERDRQAREREKKMERPDRRIVRREFRWDEDDDAVGPDRSLL